MCANKAVSAVSRFSYSLNMAIVRIALRCIALQTHQVIKYVISICNQLQLRILFLSRSRYWFCVLYVHQFICLVLISTIYFFLVFLLVSSSYGCCCAIGIICLFVQLLTFFSPFWSSLCSKLCALGICPFVRCYCMRCCNSSFHSASTTTNSRDWSTRSWRWIEPRFEGLIVEWLRLLWLWWLSRILRLWLSRLWRIWRLWRLWSWLWRLSIRVKILSILFRRLEFISKENVERKCVWPSFFLFCVGYI